jgi:K+-sensing histidine kinase KdpD
VSQPQHADIGEELLKRLIHRIARTTGAFRSTTQALLNGADEDPVLRRELLQDMEFELGELQRLLENVTQFKALENGTFALKRQELIVGPWLRQLIGRWQRTVPDKTLAWLVDMSENLPVLRVDVDKLEQVLNNLLGNAIRHTPAGARIAVRAWSSYGDLHIRIASSPGRLIADDYDHLSELFYTGEGQGRFPTGVGLGLHVARALLERQGGVLRITRPSIEDDAVGFELSVPAAADALARDGAGAGVRSAATSSVKLTESRKNAH